MDDGLIDMKLQSIEAQIRVAYTMIQDLQIENTMLKQRFDKHQHSFIAHQEGSRLE